MIWVWITHTLAYVLDSLVRVTRRVEENHFVRLLQCLKSSHNSNTCTLDINTHYAHIIVTACLLHTIPLYLRNGAQMKHALADFALMLAYWEPSIWPQRLTTFIQCCKQVQKHKCSTYPTFTDSLLPQAQNRPILTQIYPESQDLNHNSCIVTYTPL